MRCGVGGGGEIAPRAAAAYRPLAPRRQSGHGGGHPRRQPRNAAHAAARAKRAAPQRMGELPEHRRPRHGARRFRQPEKRRTRCHLAGRRSAKPSRFWQHLPCRAKAGTRNRCNFGHLAASRQQRGRRHHRHQPRRDWRHDCRAEKSRYPAQYRPRARHRRRRSSRIRAETSGQRAGV